MSEPVVGKIEFAPCCHAEVNAYKGLWNRVVIERHALAKVMSKTLDVPCVLLEWKCPLLNTNGDCMAAIGDPREHRCGCWLLWAEQYDASG
jgi:hypothetical protein